MTIVKDIIKQAIEEIEMDNPTIISPVPASSSNYRNSQALLMKEKRKSAQDIGAMPSVVDPERKEACRNDLLKYMMTYHSNSFYREFSDTHIKSIKDTENIILHGGTKAEAMPRGSGKTTMNECAIEWAINYGHRKFIVAVVESGC